MIDFYSCPGCKKISSILKYAGNLLPEKIFPIYPDSFAKPLPEYVPEAIRNDYEEACSILHLSPKASATMSRRCLQGMIRDFWGVSGKPNLDQEINAIQNLIHPGQWEVLHAVRKIGNIGAHMEKDVNLIIDVEPDEADKLIKLNEYLVDEWYVRRHEKEKLFSDILSINESKQEQRND
jgi:hypothetical protein